MVQGPGTKPSYIHCCTCEQQTPRCKKQETEAPRSWHRLETKLDVSGAAVAETCGRNGVPGCGCGDISFFVQALRLQSGFPDAKMQYARPVQVVAATSTQGILEEDAENGEFEIDDGDNADVARDPEQEQVAKSAV